MRSIGKHRGGSALVAALLVGLLVAGCGNSSTTTIVTTVTTAPGGGASTGASSTRTFVGTTSQDLQISFAVLGNTVNEVQFGWRAKCDDGQVHTNTIVLGSTPLAADGSFSASGTLNTGGYGRVDGKIDGDSASGTLSRSRGSAFDTNCIATGVAWRAHAASK